MTTTDTLIALGVIGALGLIAGLWSLAAKANRELAEDLGSEGADWSGEGQIHFHEGVSK